MVDEVKLRRVLSVSRQVLQMVEVKIREESWVDSSGILHDKDCTGGPPCPPDCGETRVTLGEIAKALALPEIARLAKEGES